MEYHLKEIQNVKLMWRWHVQVDPLSSFSFYDEHMQAGPVDFLHFLFFSLIFCHFFPLDSLW